ncbi:MAG: hypothetical protein LUM44_21875 [Pyrinomonadaceae bacterium]|nr:hypothetical protein [Pyrinomonadaceae bacterium]
MTKKAVLTIGASIVFSAGSLMITSAQETPSPTPTPMEMPSPSPTVSPMPSPNESPSPSPTVSPSPMMSPSPSPTPKSNEAVGETSNWFSDLLAKIW